MPPVWRTFAAEVEIESTEAGWLSTRFSATRAAAVQWAIMKPECKPPLATRKAGMPLREGLHIRSRRRSEMLASSEVLMARKSSA